jgi:Mn2+/Fe2+ NRAMP family transporter
MSPRDPYVLDAGLVQAPPPSLVGRLRELGPGLVLTASIVGSGELIATTRLGAETGFVALWIILLSCLVKVTLQLQFGRHTIETGETALAALNKMPGPRLRGVHWTIWFWLLIQPVKILQVGGIVGGVAIVLSMVLPVLSVAAWCWIAAAVAAVLVSTERYRLIERTCITLVGGFTLTTVISVIALQWTSYAVSAEDIARGLTFSFPAQGLLVVYGAFGLTGVGGDEILQYTYWLIEKGYAAKTGPRDASDPQWAERARQWTRTMYLDAILSMVVYTVVTAAFYVLGAAVLNARGEVPNNDQLVSVLGAMYTESLGPWAWGVFMVGAFFVLFSTLFSALAAWTRTFADAGGHFGLINFANQQIRRRTIVVLAWFFPMAWAAAYLFYKNPSWMVLVGGVGTSIMLIVVMIGAVDFRYRRTVADLQPSRLYDLALWLSIGSISAFLAFGGWIGLQRWLQPAS